MITNKSSSIQQWWWMVAVTVTLTMVEVSFQKSYLNPQKLTRFSVPYCIELSIVHSRTFVDTMNAKPDYWPKVIDKSQKIYAWHNANLRIIYEVKWTRDLIPINPNDMKYSLHNFMNYGNKESNYKIGDSNVLTMNGISRIATVGLAFLNQMCKSHSYAVINIGIKSDSYNIDMSAVTLVHEVGHNLGSNHYESRNCINDGKTQCVMFPSTFLWPLIYPPAFHSESIMQIMRSRNQCVKDCSAIIQTKTNLRSGCGNGIVDKGEDCDCGFPENCELTGQDKCCDYQTCRFKPGAQCSSGDCCDNCKFSVGKLCRKSQGECDKDDYCSGESAQCKPDLMENNGKPCDNGNAFCYDGDCNKLKGTCEKLFKSTTALVSSVCMKMVKDKKKGCSTSSEKDPICNDLDDECGYVWCKTYGYRPNEAHWRIRSYYSRQMCYAAILEPGDTSNLVPNGVKCGTNKMCVKGRCVPVNYDPNSCEKVRCKIGEICQKGKCVDKDFGIDPCRGKCNRQFEVCKYGRCVYKEGIDPCKFINCEEPKVCINGVCVDQRIPEDPCTERCDYRYQSCVNGACRLKSTWFFCGEYVCPKNSFVCRNNVCTKVDRNEECRKTCDPVSSECKNGKCLLKYGYSVCGSKYCVKDETCIDGVCKKDSMLKEEDVGPKLETSGDVKIIDPRPKVKGDCMVYQIKLKKKCYNIPKVNICEYMKCKVTEACINNKCELLEKLDGKCPLNVCPFGKHCYNKQCFYRPPIQILCALVECDKDQVCRNAVCVSKSLLRDYCNDKTCPPNEKCVSGMCVIPQNTNGCDDVKCDSDKVCMFGACVQVPPHYARCYDVKCNDGEVCNWKGKCVAKEKIPIATMEEKITEKNVGFPIPENSKNGSTRRANPKNADNDSDAEKPQPDDPKSDDDSKSDDSKPDDSKSDDSKPDDSKPDDSESEDPEGEGSEKNVAKAESSKLGVGAIVGIAIGAVALIAIVAIVVIKLRGK